MFNSLNTNRSGDMGLARAGTANQNDIVGIVDDVAMVGLTHNGTKLKSNAVVKRQQDYAVKWRYIAPVKPSETAS